MSRWFLFTGFLFRHDPLYPWVTTTLGTMKPGTKRFLKYLYRQASCSMFHTIIHSLMNSDAPYNNYWRRDLDNAIQAREEVEKRAVINEITNLPDFRCQGVALGQASASYLSGDTIASVFVGGMITVQNGAFPNSSGDPAPPAVAPPAAPPMLAPVRGHLG
jgi:hypothetical protein